MRFLVFGLLIFSFNNTIQQSDNEIRLIYPKEWHSSIEDPIFSEGQRYFGIYRRDHNQSYITYFNGKDSICNTPLIGKHRIVVSDSIMPDFLIHGLDLKDKTLFPGRFYDDLMIFPGQTIRFYLNKKVYILYSTVDLSPVSGGVNPYSNLTNYKLILRLFENKASTDQILYKGNFNSWGPGGYEGGIFIKWIGDLNNDALVDILLTKSSNYHSKEFILLMGMNDSDKLIGEVAKYGFSGD